MKRTPTKRRAPVSKAAKKASGSVIDDYLAQVPEPARTTLEKLRRTVQAAAPKATETLSYQLPAFSYLGPLVGFRATPKFCALYVMSGTVLEPFKDELSAYDTSKGTIRFPVDAPLPAALVKKLVKARIAENEQLAMSKTQAPKSARKTKGAASKARR
ncbi:iron chaperone [Hyalangium versicolor]|uniref:iron chaperone n=1 Tax=Hyalangium versicolor TaxID=2861190 RepID=UPI001CCD00FE|nr:DUF1801 domain-containing protein [Hyalangium versicolor]